MNDVTFAHVAARRQCPAPDHDVWSHTGPKVCRRGGTRTGSTTEVQLRTPPAALPTRRCGTDVPLRRDEANADAARCSRGRRMTALSHGEVSISAERSPDASIAAASGGSSRPARKNRRAATGHARPNQPEPPRPASASTSSRRPTPHGWCPPLPDQVPGGRDRGPATVARSERGAALRRQCPERSGTAVGTSRPRARHWRRQIAQQLPPAPPGRPLGGEPPQRPAPATRHRGVQPSAEPARGRHQAGDDCTREPQAQGRRQRRGTSPRPARSQPARRWSPDRQYSRDQPGGRASQRRCTTCRHGR